MIGGHTAAPTTGTLIRNRHLVPIAATPGGQADLVSRGQRIARLGTADVDAIYLTGHQTQPATRTTTTIAPTGPACGHTIAMGHPTPRVTKMSNNTAAPRPIRATPTGSNTVTPTRVRPGGIRAGSDRPCILAAARRTLIGPGTLTMDRRTITSTRDRLFANLTGRIAALTGTTTHTGLLRILAGHRGVFGGMRGSSAG